MDRDTNTPPLNGNQQVFVYEMPAISVVSDLPFSHPVPGVFDSFPARTPGTFAPQGFQFGFDPIFQVLQASLNQIGNGNHRKTSAEGMGSLVNLRIRDGENLDCAISAETLENGAWVSRMPCGHYFSRDSLVSWLSGQNTCPVCRYELHTVDEDYNRRRNLSPVSDLSIESRLPVDPHDLLCVRVEQAHKLHLDSLAEDALSDFKSHSQTSTHCIVSQPADLEENQMTEEWLDALCDLVLFELCTEGGEPAMQNRFTTPL